MTDQRPLLERIPVEYFGGRASMYRREHVDPALELLDEVMTWVDAHRELCHCTRFTHEKCPRCGFIARYDALGAGGGDEG